MPWNPPLWKERSSFFIKVLFSFIKDFAHYSCRSEGIRPHPINPTLSTDIKVSFYSHRLLLNPYGHGIMLRQKFHTEPLRVLTRSLSSLDLIEPFLKEPQAIGDLRYDQKYRDP